MKHKNFNYNQKPLVNAVEAKKKKRCSWKTVVVTINVAHWIWKGLNFFFGGGDS